MFLAVLLATGFIWNELSGEKTSSAKSLQTPSTEKFTKAVEVEKPAEVTPPIEIAQPVDVPPSVENVQQSDKFIIANQDFSNLQMYEYNKPVYDSYGYWQRQEGGMATVIPDLQPYYGEHIVYLTFDDGPDNKNTPQILDILRAENVPATFYVLGAMVERNPDVLKRIFNEGHAIGNHSYNHNYNEL